MEALVRRMAKRLAGRYARKRHRAKKGMLDVRKTLARSMAHGGIPFEIIWKARTLHKPKIVVLCDVSRSVAAAARFLLLFLYSLNEVVERLDAFAFSDRLVCVNDLLDDEKVDEAIALILGRIGFPARPTMARRWRTSARHLAKPGPAHHGDHPGRWALEPCRSAPGSHPPDRREVAGADLAQSGAADLLEPGRFQHGRLPPLLPRGQDLQHLGPAGENHRGCAADLSAQMRPRT